MKTQLQKLQTRIKLYILIIIFGLLLSGITAFPLESEIGYLAGHSAQLPTALQRWLNTIHQGLKDTNKHYPFLSYGTDWLAFAHLMLAILFIGPYKEPVKNIWVIQFGIICCILIIPLALIAGEVRGIPFFSRLIDCSFGIVGSIPLLLCVKNVKKITRLSN